MTLTCVFLDRIYIPNKNVLELVFSKFENSIPMVNASDNFKM